MFISDIENARTEANRFLERLEMFQRSDNYQSAIKGKSDHVWGNAESAALKRSSMDLTKSLAKLRNNR